MPWPYSDRDIQRFLSMAAASGANACILWTGTVNGAGYGTCMTGSRTDDSRQNVMAHRLALEIKLGRSIRPKHVAAHMCDIKLCINEDHLVEWTQAQNLADMRAKGRANVVSPSGEASGMSKLTEAHVIAIRRRYAAGGITQTRLGKEFGVSQFCISTVILRKTWRHVA